MILRRVLLLALLALAGCGGADAQQPARVPKVAILAPGEPGGIVCESGIGGSVVGCFVDELRKLGYVDGRNISIEYRFANGVAQRLPALASELVKLQPDVIYTHTMGGAEVAASATATIPIVVGPAGEGALTRLAGDLARPRSNVTGTTLHHIELEEKCLQLLKELAPRSSRVAVLLNPDNPGWREYPQILVPAASRLGLTLVRIEARSGSDVPRAFAAMSAAGVDAVYLVDDSALAGDRKTRKQIAELAAKNRWPLVSSNANVASDGGLVSIGTDIPALGRRAAFYVHRILNGAKVSDLPVERPTTYKLTVNRKTAAMLDVQIPQSLLLRADEVIH